MSALSDIHILAGQISVWLNTGGFQCRLADVRQPSSVSATTWSSVCISASFFVIDWLNCNIRAIERSAASLTTVSEQTIDWACWNAADVLYVCGPHGSHDKMKSLSTPREWRAGTDELLTRSLNCAVDRSRDLSAFRPLTFHCTSGSYVWRIRSTMLPFMCVDKLLENKESGTSSGPTYQRWFSNFGHGCSSTSLLTVE